jgi:hypothetical protein
VLALPGFVRTLRPPEPIFYDFFQDWASARFFQSGQPVYSDLRLALKTELGHDWDEKQRLPVHVNGHPPSSILLFLPFAALDYLDAFLVWNLCSLGALILSVWLLLAQRRIVTEARTLLPLAAVLLVANPLQEQLILGQLNLVLLLLVAGMWAAQRSGKPLVAGVCLGIATAIKVFPGFFLVYYALCGKWRVVVVGLLTLTGVTALTVLVLGPDTYRAFVTEVLPHLRQFEDYPENASLMGFWYKLFAGAGGFVQPLCQVPALARAATWGTNLAIFVVFCWCVRGGRAPAQEDLTFALATSVMLLLAPITWNHYLLLLLPALAIWWTAPEARRQRWAFLSIVAMWTLGPEWLGSLATPESASGIGPRFGPLHTLTVLSFSCYTLLAAFAFAVVVVRRSGLRKGAARSAYPAAVTSLG